MQVQSCPDKQQEDFQNIIQYNTMAAVEWLTLRSAWQYELQGQE